MYMLTNFLESNRRQVLGWSLMALFSQVPFTLTFVLLKKHLDLFPTIAWAEPAMPNSVHDGSSLISCSSDWSSTGVAVIAGISSATISIVAGRGIAIAVLEASIKPCLDSDLLNSVATADTGELTDLQLLGFQPAWGLLRSQRLAYHQTFDFGKFLGVRGRQPTTTVNSSDQMLKGRTEMSIHDDKFVEIGLILTEKRSLIEMSQFIILNWNLFDYDRLRLISNRVNSMLIN